MFYGIMLSPSLYSVVLQSLTLVHPTRQSHVIQQREEEEQRRQQTEGKRRRRGRSLPGNWGEGANAVRCHLQRRGNCGTRRRRRRGEGRGRR
ncbi:hypothetical protein GBAR_LOCUS31488 [Geodia barretti]|uniref:Uncharacterized protein n=1 Tax=Geodia barretti TaxID=519541 RepID=A0AA35U387_GEOBA|nr:hypothetical protein GBAR_LOCUS31488 [Geodia barretti]